MPTIGDQMPEDRGWLQRRLRYLERQVQLLRTARRLVAATIGSGGLTVDGGYLRVFDLTGVELLHVGGISPVLNDGTPQRGILVRRSDGTLVLALFDAFPGDGSPSQYRQALNWYDRSGEVVIADDTDSGRGIARPYIPWTHTCDADNRSTTSGTFAILHTFATERQHPKVSIGLSAYGSDATTTGEVRIIVGSTVVAGPTLIPANNSIAPHYVFTLPPGQHLDLAYIDIQARRTAGTGAIVVRPYYQHGTQT